ncbi:gamma-butyrobetaine hydroxylase-like domain-containing protein [Bradyrhizobium elkanii]|uniref:gamma-butyrobetaine hydroxylase-like domain-containing protein n=1 Tax=Bradyrhizobium elkanii TaxID=29448 RepID=UPI000685CCFD|nr:DUF971 domain-containing protein [Bradyrhizobium elkanii]
MQLIEVELRDDSTVLALIWPDSRTRLLAAETLRRASRAASEIRRQVDDIELMVAPGLHITAIEPIGNYALRLSFSDGHDRGIYPFSYLRELAERQPA